MKSVQVIESYAKSELIKAHNVYKNNPNYDNALAVLGLYDFLMKIYDYGMNESKLYTDYYYTNGIMEAFDSIFRPNVYMSKEDAVTWINSYNGALSDVKWYRTKAQIEYYQSMGVTVPVTVNTYYEGKVVNSQSFDIPYGNVLDANYNREQELPKYFEDETIIRYFSELYYDMEYTKPYTPVIVKAPLTLYMRMNIGRQPVVYVNGQKVEFLDQKALLQDNRTLVPARGVFETMGATVVWNGDQQTVAVRIGTHDVIIPIGESYILVDSEKRAIDVPAQIINNRTMLPVRAVAEAFECEVKWDAENYIVYINTK